jgi:hypothetical protein
VLNTFIEHDFQVALKMADALGMVHILGRDYFEGDDVQ